MKTFHFDFMGGFKKCLLLSGVLLAVSLVGLLVFGAQLDIQFKGGALMTYAYDGQVDQAQFAAVVQEVLGEKPNIQQSTDVATGRQNLVVSLAAVEGVTSDQQLALAQKLEEIFPGQQVEAVSVNVVSPAIGKEFLLKSALATLYACIFLVAYTGFSFRKIGGMLAGLAGVAALLHDVWVVFAVFILFRIPIDINFIAVVLTILGFSLNDTIVVFDRVRENQRKFGGQKSLGDLMNLSINQSVMRAFYTTLTSVIAMVAVSAVAWYYHVDSILSFSFPIIFGLLSGVYSSLCLSGPLWVLWKGKAKQAKA